MNLKGNVSLLVGTLASITSMILWVILNFYNPYTHNIVETDVLLNTFFMLAVPTFIALISSLLRKPLFMYIAFVWSLPLSLYMTLTPSIFMLFGLTSLFYLLSAIGMSLRNKKITGSF